MKKVLLLSFLLLLLFNQKNYAAPVAVMDVYPTSEKVEVQKKKKKKKRFFNRLTKRILEKKIGKMVKKMGLYPVVDSTKCDVLLKSDGEEMNVRVIEVGVETIKFKKCEDENGSTFSLNKKAVFMIKYADGEKAVFKNIESTREGGMATQRVAMEEGSSSGGFGIGLVLGVLLGLLGVVIAVVAFDGKKRKNAIKGALLGILASFLLLLFLLAALFGL